MKVECSLCERIVEARILTQQQAKDDYYGDELLFSIVECSDCKDILFIAQDYERRSADLFDWGKPKVLAQRYGDNRSKPSNFGQAVLRPLSFWFVDNKQLRESLVKDKAEICRLCESGYPGYSVIPMKLLINGLLENEIACLGKAAADLYATRYPNKSGNNIGTWSFAERMSIVLDLGIIDYPTVKAIHRITHTSLLAEQMMSSLNNVVNSKAIFDNIQTLASLCLILEKRYKDKMKKREKAIAAAIGTRGGENIWKPLKYGKQTDEWREQD